MEVCRRRREMASDLLERWAPSMAPPVKRWAPSMTPPMKRDAETQVDAEMLAQQANDKAAPADALVATEADPAATANEVMQDAADDDSVATIGESSKERAPRQR